jgi:hypothetical protein
MRAIAAFLGMLLILVLSASAQPRGDVELLAFTIQRSDSLIFRA